MHAIVSKLSPHVTDLIRADHARVVATFHRYKSDVQPATKHALAGALVAGVLLVQHVRRDA